MKFWIEKLIINSAGELGFRGTQFHGHKELQRSCSKFGFYFLDTGESLKVLE